MMWSWRYNLAFALIIIGFLCILFFTFSSAFNDGSYKLNPILAAQYGSFIGGFVGSIFSLSGVLLLFETLNSQKTAFQKQQFENSFFHLLSIYRGNVSEMKHTPCICGENQKEHAGRSVFIELRREFGAIYQTVCAECESDQCDLNEVHKVNISYTLLLFGTGESTKEIVDEIIYSYGCHDTINSILNKISFDDAIQERFEGHQSRLGHYFRHLYHFLKYINTVPYLSQKEKKQFIEIIKAQLSTFELVLIFINALSTYENSDSQYKKDLLNRYSILEGIPQGFVFGLNPNMYFDID